MQRAGESTGRAIASTTATNAGDDDGILLVASSVALQEALSAPRQAFQAAYPAHALARGVSIAEGWALGCTDSASLVSVIPKGRPELGSKSQR